MCRSLAKPSHCRTNPDPSTIRNTILKTYKIYTGAHRCAPCRSTFRNTPLPLPRTHPITLTPDTGAASDTAISLRFCLQTHGLAHIMGIDDTGTMGGVAASAGAPAGRNGMGRTANQGIKRGPRIAPRPLKILCDGACLPCQDWCDRRRVFQSIIT